MKLTIRKEFSMRTHWILGCALGLFAINASPATAAAPPDAARCAKCHGDNGVSRKPEVPTIAGVSAPYFEAQMSAYQKGQRPCPKLSDPKLSDTDMCQVAKKLGAAQIKELSAYYAGLKFAAGAQQTDPALAAKGKAIHDAHCDVCHSDGGSEAADDAGILAGQSKAYLQETMQDYVTGRRVAPDKMKHQMTMLSADNVKALAEYYASERGK
jgi:cytochrome subunit of sulfide dehydrogenase